MNLISAYQAESAKFALLAKQAKVNAGSKAVEEATAIANAADIEYQTVAKNANDLAEKVAHLSTDLEAANAHITKVETSAKLDLEAALATGTTADIIKAKRLEIELGDLKKGALEKSIAFYEHQDLLEAARLMLLDAKAFADTTSNDVKVIVHTLADLNVEYELAREDFEKIWPNIIDLSAQPLDTKQLAGEGGLETAGKAHLRFELSEGHAKPSKLNLSTIRNQENINPNIDELAKLQGDLHLAAQETDGLIKELNHARSTIANLKGDLTARCNTQNRLSSDLNTASKKINDLRSEIDEVLNEKQALKIDLTEAKDVIEAKTAEIQELEKVKDQFFAQLNGAHDTVERLSKELHDTRISSSQPTTETSDLAKKVSEITAKYIFEETLNSDLKKKLNYALARVSKLESQLSTNVDKVHDDTIHETAQIEIKRLEAELERLAHEKGALLAELESFKSNAVSSNRTSEPLLENKVDSASASAAATIAQLKSTIEQMMPLYDVGHLVRSRKLELGKAKVYQNRDVMQNGHEVAFSGLAVADATMFLDSAIRKYDPPSEFATRYGLPPTFVWENRNFKMFAEVLSMKMNMDGDRTKFSNVREKFMAKCKRFLQKIYPSMEISSDGQVMEIPEMLELFSDLKGTYAAACYQYEQSRFGNRKSSLNPAN